MWIFDATPLIYLAKVDQLSLLEALDGSCVIPEQVYDEVVETGIEQGYQDARQIEQRVEDGLFDVVSVEATNIRTRLDKNDKLSQADVAVLAFANANDGIAVMDESYGRDVAATENVETRGTAFLVLRLVSDGAISSEEARDVIDDMLDAGWYCAPDVYRRIVQKIDSIGDN